MAYYQTIAEELAKDIIWKELDQILEKPRRPIIPNDKIKISFNNKEFYVKDVMIDRGSELLDIITTDGENIVIPFYKYDREAESYFPTEIWVEFNP